MSSGGTLHIDILTELDMSQQTGPQHVPKASKGTAEAKVLHWQLPMIYPLYIVAFCFMS